jgi:2-methylcitrate dehydratase PrpD
MNEKLFIEVLAKYIHSVDEKLQYENRAIIEKLFSIGLREIRIFKKTTEYKKLCTIYDMNKKSDKAFIYSYAIHHRDFDEMSFSIGGHPTATLLPILLAYNFNLNQSETKKLFFKALKIEIVLGRVFNPELYNTQYHPTTIIGLFGATALASKILELNLEQIFNAFGIAFSFLSGVRGNFGSNAKALQVAHVSQYGVLCAKLAKSNFTSNLELLSKNNTLSLFIGKNLTENDLRKLKRLLNSKLMLKNEFLFKNYNVCGSYHCLIERALLDRKKFFNSNIKIKNICKIICKIIIKLNPANLSYKMIKYPTNNIQKIFSPSYIYAYTLLGRNLNKIDSAEPIDNEVFNLMKKIEIKADNKIKKWHCKTEILFSRDFKEDKKHTV